MTPATAKAAVNRGCNGRGASSLEGSTDALGVGAGPEEADAEDDNAVDAADAAAAELSAD